MFSETTRCVGFPDDSPWSRGSLVGFSETVFALDGRFDPRLGGRGSGAVNPNALGSFLSGPGGLLVNPINRASFGRAEFWWGEGTGMGCATAFVGSTMGSASLVVGSGAIGSGLLDGELSSPLGGVLNGEIRASKEALRASGFKTLPAGSAIVVGLAGIFGFSALLTGGFTTDFAS